MHYQIEDFAGKVVYLNGQDISALSPVEANPEGGWVKVRRVKPDAKISFKSRNVIKLRGKVEIKPKPGTEPKPKAKAKAEPKAEPEMLRKEAPETESWWNKTL